MEEEIEETREVSGASEKQEEVREEPGDVLGETKQHEEKEIVRVSEEKEIVPAASESIYLDNDTSSPAKKTVTQPKPPRRLTRAERARQEALASFGCTDLASVTVKKRDLREELRRDATLMEQGKNRVKRKAKVHDSSAGFKDVLFGESRVTRKRKLEPSSVATDSNPPKLTRRMTKAERARQDALQSFGGCGFDDVMATSRKKIAKTFEMKPEKEDERENEEEETGEEEREGEREDEGEVPREAEKENVESVPAAIEA